MTRKIEYRTETLRDILDADSQRKLVLPNFQRDFVWNNDKQSKLLASILVGLPIGSILIVDGQKDNFRAQRLGYVGFMEPAQECRYLLDGQQRLSCLKSIFADPFSPEPWNDSWKQIFKGLRKRWFLKIKQVEGVDLWGYKKLKLERNPKEFDPSEIAGFIVCHQIEDVKTKSTKWYHPAFSLGDGDEEMSPNRRKSLLAKRYAQECVVPLFDVYSSCESTDQIRSLHRKTLDCIARSRRDELEMDYQDGKISLQEIFDPHEVEDLEEASRSEEGDFEKELATAWSKLSTDWVSGVSTALENLLQTQITETILSSDEIHRAVAIFEAMNLGGTPLSTFDLVVAKAARIGERGSLSDLLKEFVNKTVNIPQALYSSGGEWKLSWMRALEGNSISRNISDQFLNLLSILSYEKVMPSGINAIKVEHIKRKKILELKPDQVTKNSERAIEALVKAFAFLQYRCGIISVTDLSYELMLLPIAYLFSTDNSDSSNRLAKEGRSIWEDEKGLDKIEYWYWTSLFSGRYKESQNQTCIDDIKKLTEWFFGDQENPFSEWYDNVLSRVEYSDSDILLLENSELRPSKSIREGILQYILSQEPRDFKFTSDGSSGSSISKLKPWRIASDSEQIEKHHIIPLGSATKIGETSSLIRSDDSHPLNSPLNFTYISKDANREIRDKSPQAYLQLLANSALTDHMVSEMVSGIGGKSPAELDSYSSYKDLLRKRFESLRIKILAELENLISED